MRGDDTSGMPRELEDRLVELAALGQDERHLALDELRAEHPDSAEFLDLWESEIAPLLTDAPGEARGIDVPDSIGPYRVLEVLGSGGMGTVYKAEQRAPVRRLVALKVVQPGLATKQVLARFELERRALAAMNHRYIAKVFDAGATETGQPYFVMEYVEGLPITTYCDKHLLSLSERLELFGMVCQGVQHAHQKGVVHRDLKPGNVLVVREGDEAVPKVVDFGLAKATNRDFLAGTLCTEVDRVLGTPEYMAPEQASGDGEVIDSRADIYSLGVMLYELLTGELPFPTAELREAGTLDALRLIQEQDPPKPSTRLTSTANLASESAEKRRITAGALSKALKGDLDWVVMRAMAKEPERRYDSATSLALDLRRYLDHEPVLAGPPSAAYRLRKFARRYRVQLLAAGLVFLALTAGIVGTAIGLVRAQRQESLANENAQLAEDAAKRARTAETAAKRQAAELEQLAGFQSSQLRDLEPSEMAIDLRDAVLREARAAMNRAQLEAREIDARVEELDHLLYGVNFTNVALDTLAENLFDHALETIESEFEEQPSLQALLWQSTAINLRELGLLEMAIEPQRRAVAARREKRGDDHPSTLTSINHLGRLLLARGELPEAELLFREAMEGRIEVLGEDHPFTLDSMSNLGLVLRERDELPGAESLLRKDLKLTRANLGEHDPRTLTSMLNLAGVLRLRGEIAEAETLLREGMDGRRRTLGDDHVDTLTAMNNLAVLLEREQRPAEAEPLFRSAYEGLRQRLGDDHPDTLASLANLAVALVAQGKLAEAEPLLREALEGQRRVLGNGHPDTLNNLDKLGGLLEKRRQPAEAEDLYREALAGRRRMLGDDHELTLTTIDHLALLLARQGRLEQAEDLYREAVERRRRLLGDTRPLTLATINGLGRILAKQGRLAEAESLYREALEGRREVLGRDHPLTLSSTNNLGLLLKRRGELPEAESLYREALEGLRRTLGDRDPQTLTATSNLGVLLKAQGKLEEAEPLCREALETRREVLGDDHPHTLGSIQILGTVVAERGDLADAEELYREALEGRLRVLGPDNRATLASKSSLAVVLTECGRRRLRNGEPAAAAGPLREAHQLMSDLGDEHDSRVTNCLELLIELYETWHAEDPGAGHDAEARRWREQLSDRR